QPLDTPAGNVRHQDVVSEVQLGFDEEDPAGGSTPAELEPGQQDRAQDARHPLMLDARSWEQVEYTVDDLGDLVVGGVEDILIGRAAASWSGHGQDNLAAGTDNEIDESHEHRRDIEIDARSEMASRSVGITSCPVATSGMHRYLRSARSSA